MRSNTRQLPEIITGKEIQLFQVLINNQWSIPKFGTVLAACRYVSSQCGQRFV